MNTENEVKPTNETEAGMVSHSFSTALLSERSVPEPKRGLEFLHRRIIYPDTKTPARMIVTAIRKGGVYYRFLGGGGKEFVTMARWPFVAASLDNVQGHSRGEKI